MTALGWQLVAIIRRDLRVLRSYQFALVLRAGSIAFLALMLYYISRLVDSAPELEEYSGQYFDFVVVGLAVLSMGTLGLRSFNRTISAETGLGTLEMLLVTPIRMVTILVGSFLMPLLTTLVQTLVLLVLGIGVFGSGITWSGVLRAIPVLLLTVVLFSSAGLLSAAIIIVTKRGDPFALLMTQGSTLLSGAIFPITLLPGWLQGVAVLIPVHPALEATRAVLLTGASLGDVLVELGVLLGWCVVLLPSGMWLLRGALRTARRAGTLGSY